MFHILLRNCKSVHHIPDVAKGVRQKRDFAYILSSVTDVQDELNITVEQKRTGRKQLKRSAEDIWYDVKKIKENLSNTLEKIETETLKLLDELVSDIDTFIENEIDTCTATAEELKRTADAMNDEQQTDEPLTFPNYKRCQKKMKEISAYLQSKSDSCSNVTFTPYGEIEKFFSVLEHFGPITKVDNSTNEAVDSTGSVAHGIPFPTPPQATRTNLLTSLIKYRVKPPRLMTI